MVIHERFHRFFIDKETNTEPLDMVEFNSRELRQSSTIQEASSITRSKVENQKLTNDTEANSVGQGTAAGV